MAHITLPDGLPGILGPLTFRPETGKHLRGLTEVLLRDDNSLSRGYRELIASYVSYLNDCFFCQNSHGGLAQHYLNCDAEFIDGVKSNFQTSDLPDKIKALLAIAGSVQKGGKFVTEEQVEKARSLGASDLEIHDTVLIAATFCMANRYVDGLATWAPHDKSVYASMAKKRAEEGYLAGILTTTR